MFPQKIVMILRDNVKKNTSNHLFKPWFRSHLANWVIPDPMLSWRYWLQNQIFLDQFINYFIVEFSLLIMSVQENIKKNIYMYSTFLTHVM
jgi:hypothetical protein